MDYNKEVKELEAYQSKNWFKPKPGTYKVLILSEPRPTEYKAEDGKVTPQIELDIEVNLQHYTWTAPKGLTMASLYGQLMKIGKDRGKLEGQTITLIVKSDGKKNDYTVVEANVAATVQ